VNRIKHEPRIWPALLNLKVIFFFRVNVSCSSKPHDSSSIRISRRWTSFSVLLEKDMASRSMGKSSSLVAWVQMISPWNPASIRSGTRPMWSIWAWVRNR